MVKVVKAYCNNHNDSNYNEYYEEGTEKQGRPPVCKNGHQSANLKKKMATSLQFVANNGHSQLLRKQFSVNIFD